MARSLGKASGRAVIGLLVGDDPEGAGGVLATYLEHVLAMPSASGRSWAAAAADSITDRVDPTQDLVLIGADPEGLAVAGMLVGRTDLPILVNATGISWGPDGVEVQMSTFGGRLQTTSSFTDGGGGIVVVRPGAAPAAPADTVGMVEVLATPR